MNHFNVSALGQGLHHIGNHVGKLLVNIPGHVDLVESLR